MNYYGHNYEQMHDGGPCPSKDCVPAVHVTLTDTATAGRWKSPRVTAPNIRSAAGSSCWSGTGGMSFDAADRGVAYRTNGEVNFNVRYWINAQMLRDAVKAGKPADVSTLYSVFLGTPYACSEVFRGRHSVGLLHIRYNARLRREEGLIADPLADGRVLPSGRRCRKGLGWVPMSLIYRAANASAGGSSVHATFAPDTTNAVKTVVSTSARVYSDKSLTSRAVATLTAGTKVTVVGARTGTRWTFGDRVGTGWWRLSHVAGVAVTTRYGQSSVFMAGAVLK